MLRQIIKKEDGKYYVSITFSHETEEHLFLSNILTMFGRTLPVNCMITDLDTSYPHYEAYFERDNYYIFDRVTKASIFAYRLNQAEIERIISNWGYYTIDAMFSLGVCEDEVLIQKPDYTDGLRSMPIVITQVLDNSIEITVDQYYFDDISKLLDR